jgi:hypothetical protein
MIPKFEEKNFAKAVYDLESAVEEVKLTKTALGHVTAELARAEEARNTAERTYERTKRALEAVPPRQSVTVTDAPTTGTVPE